MSLLSLSMSSLSFWAINIALMSPMSGVQLASIGQSIHPFLRMLRGMKDRIDVNGFGLNAVEDHVRELLDDRSARVFCNELKCFWTAPNGPQAPFHALKKNFAHATLLLFIPFVGLLDIAFRRWQ